MQLPTPPPWMADLPLPMHPRAAFQKLPSTAASRWVSGQPTAQFDQRKLRILAIRRRCWCCGYPTESPHWTVITDAEANHRYGQLHTQTSGPLHLSCALYACLACPFLRYPTSRRRLTGDGTRGIACIKGFDQFGLFIPPRNPNVYMTFGYFMPIGTTELTSLASTAELYEKSLTADTASDLTATPRLFWTDAPDDARHFQINWFSFLTTLQAARTEFVTINGHCYRGQLITKATGED